MPKTESQANGVQRVISDIIDLCELQWQLLSVDGQEAKRRAAKAAVFLLVGALIALSALLAAVIGIGWVVHEQLGLSVGISFLLTSGVSLVIATLASLIGANLLSKANESLRETKREFAENVRWIKSVVLQPNTSPRNQLRRASFSPELADPEESRFQHYL